jgi:outer membrane protein assembly factor BamB
MYRTSGEPPPLVIAVVGNVVNALDRRTGETVWTAATEPSNATYRIAMRVAVGDNYVVVFSAGSPTSMWSADVAPIVTALDFATGQVRWRVELNRIAVNVGLVEGTLMIDQDQVLVATMATLTALSLVDGRVQWSEALQGASGEGPRPIALAVPGRSQQADRN